ncbi:MAG: hypothetical protein AAF465_14840 [Pseudomonadota bacterium]
MTRCFHIVAGALALLLAVEVRSDTAVEPSEPPHFQNISIALFDPGIPADPSTHRQLGVFPEVRKIEAQFLPFVLRELLEDSDQWGAVRVVPELAPGDELAVSGRIIASNGERLEVELSANDALGRQWLINRYSMESGTGDPNSMLEISQSFKNVFRQFADDLLVARRPKTPSELERNREVALLRYASALVPSVYGDYLRRDAAGTISLNRLPAANDAMLDRIRRIRAFEYRFIDAIDEQYEALYSQTENTYNLWLRYQERLTRYRLDGERNRQNQQRSDRPGSYNAMMERYEQYKWLKLEEQNLRKWASGFRNEVDPTVVEVEGRVVELDGSLAQRYAEWRALLDALFEQETGLP